MLWAIEIALMQSEPLLISIQVEPGTTVGQALEQCGWAALEGLQWQAAGIWGKVCSPTCLLQPGDRIELYEPLQCDPKTARRKRAQKKDY